MNILIVGQHYWPESFRINEVASSLVQAGHSVDVLTAQPNYPEGHAFPGYKAYGFGKEEKNGVNIFRTPLITRGKNRSIRRVLNYFSFVFSACLFGPFILRQKKYDVVFVYAVSPIFQAIPAILMSWIKGARTVVWVQDLWPESLDAMGVVRHKKILWTISLIVKAIYRFTDLILVQSNAFKAPVHALAPNKEIVYFPNSVESFFAQAPTGTPPEAVNSIKDFTVLFAGNVGVGQAVEVIADAAERLKNYSDINFVVLGNGSKWAWLNEQTKIRNLTNLQLLGRFPVETMPFFINKASALLVTLADEPIFAMTIPNKIQAYLAGGKPIIGCLNGEGANLILEADAGLTAPAENAEKLAEAVLKLYRMKPEEREVLGANGKAFYNKHFDHEMLMQKLIGFFKGTL